jgi:cell division septation protein DedD
VPADRACALLHGARKAGRKGGMCSMLPADRRPDKCRPYVRCLCRVILLSLTATSVTALASAQQTERARVVLRYERSATAVKACPDEATFRGLVAARLGYEPFVDESELALLVELRPRGNVVAGSLELTARGVARGERAMSSAPQDCYELAASLALAAAVAVDPERAGAQATAPKRDSEPEKPPPATPPATAPPPGEPGPALHPSTAPPHAETAMGLLLHPGALVSSGMQPAPAPGLRLGAALAGNGKWSVGLELAAFLPSDQKREYAAVSAHALYGSLLPCVHPGSPRFTIDLCAALSVGALLATAKGVTRSQPMTDRYTTVGARLGITFMASDSVGFALDAEAPVALSRVHLLVDDAGVSREAWAASRVGFIGGARVVLKLR